MPTRACVPRGSPSPVTPCASPVTPDRRSRWSQCGLRCVGRTNGRIHSTQSLKDTRWPASRWRELVVLVLAHAAKASQITWRSLRRVAPVTEPIDEERWQLQTEQEALQNLRSVLELCANGKLKVSDKTFKPSAAALETITEHLVNGDFYDDEAIAAFAWPLLVQAGGLAKLEGGRLRLTPKGRAALDKPAAETIRLLWWRWLSHGVIDEFSRIEQIKGQRATNVLTAVKPRREIVAKALAG